MTAGSTVCSGVFCAYERPQAESNAKNAAIILECMTASDSLGWQAAGFLPPPLSPVSQPPPAASLIFDIASSMVKLFGFWTAGKSLNVSANFPATAWTA